MKPSIIILITAAVASIYGCAANYQLPDGAPKATLLFTTNKGPQTFVGLWKIEATTCPSASKTALLLDKQTGANDTPVVIEAGTPFVVKAEMASMAYPIGPRTCHVAGVFTPQPGATYKLRHLITDRGCGMDLLISNPGGWARENSFKPLSASTEEQICSSLVR